MGRVLPIFGLLLNHSECDPVRSRSLREQERQVWDGCGLGTQLCLCPAMTQQAQVVWPPRSSIVACDCGLLDFLSWVSEFRAGDSKHVDPRRF